MLILFVWIGIQYLSDPMDFIDQPIDDLVLESDSVFQVDFLPQERLYHSITLRNTKPNDIRFLVSMPIEIPNEGLPVILILGGLEIGQFTLKYIPDPGKNIIVAYQYPYHPEYWYQGSALEEIPTIRSSVLSVPSQVLSIINWLSVQNWSDKNRITVTGYSFGALFVPAIYHLAVHQQVPLKYGVIAYGGVDIYYLLVTNMNNFSQPFRSLYSWIAAVAIRGIEPSVHAPLMEAEFLVINGTEDHQIPKESWQHLHRLIPDPKTIVILEEGHMHPRKTDLTRRLVKLSHDWLIKKGMANK
jgi:dienelactone hydrolase